jgi:hypothetical protein
MTRVTTSDELPGVEVMGIGYDINGKYANTKSLIGQPLFDFGNEMEHITFDGHTFSYPACMHVVGSFESEFVRENSASLEEYRQQLGLNVGVSGSYNLFSSSLSVDFDSTDLMLTQTYYTAIREVHRLWTVTLPGTAWLRQHLQPDAKLDINNPELTPEVLFSRYGAYFVAEAGIGGRLDYTSATRSLRVEQGLSIATAAQASYQALVGAISVTTGSQLERQINSFREASKVLLNTVGGKPGLNSRILHGPDSQAAFGEWAASLLDYATLMEFSKESLRPIWDLAEDPGRAATLREAFPVFMENAQLPIEKIKQVLWVDRLPPMLPQGTDEGSRAREDLSVFRPSTSDVYKWVGQYGQRDHSSVANGRTPIIADAFGLGVLSAPMGWLKVWTDKGSGTGKYFACWRPIPPQGYRALGDVMVLGTDSYEPPNKDGDEFKSFVCVHESVCTNVEKLQDRLWWDKGTGAKADLTLWHSGASDALDAHTFIGIASYQQPPSEQDLRNLEGTLACVKSSAVMDKKELEQLLARHPALSERVTM